MKNALKSLFIAAACFAATTVGAADVTFTISDIFDGTNLSVDVTSPIKANVSTNASKSNSKTGKLGSDGNYFQVVFTDDTFTAVSINGFINTNDTSKNWAFQFSMDKGATWSDEQTQANDGTKTAHDITVNTTIPANANGFRVVRRAGTATTVNTITFTLAGGSEPTTTSVTGITVQPTTLNMVIGDTISVSYTIAPANATNQNITWSSSNPSVASVTAGLVQALAAGTATITVTTTDGGFTATCAVTVTEPAAPVAVTGVTLSKTATTIYVGATETLIATIHPTDATNRAVTWTSSDETIATVANGVITAKAIGSATITITTTDGGFTATCNVTVESAPVINVTGVTLNKTSLTLKAGATETLTATVAPTNATNKNITWGSSATIVATVDQNGKVTAVSAGSATITVTTEDGNKTATCIVTVNTVNNPKNLTCHEPEIYEAKSIAGGYDGTLIEYQGREYEVYYTGKTSNSEASICVRPNTQKQEGITVNSTSSVKAKDGWFEGQMNGISNVSLSANAEFEAGSSNAYHKMANNEAYTFYVKGFDQFSFLGKDKKTDTSSKQDKPDNNQLFEVYIDEVLQPAQTNTSSITLRRYDITPGEHIIEVRAVKNGNSEFYGFSLRVSQTPRAKYLKGNDTTQVILQTAAPQPVYYTTKYYTKGMPELLWEGNAAEGLKLETKGQNDLRDTSYLAGTANCPVGEYTYYVVTKLNGAETSRSRPGRFTVARKLEFVSSKDTTRVVYTGTAIAPIAIRYYSTDDEALSLEWLGTAKPAEGEFEFTIDPATKRASISGTPANAGDYTYQIKLTDAEPIQGKISVKSNDPTDIGADKTMLYLTKDDATPTNGVFKLLNTKYNYFSRAAGKYNASAYDKFDVIVISEDVNADNEEVLNIVRGKANKPVLNMQPYTYAPGRIDSTGWGEPNYGTLTDEGKSITVVRDDHPVFANFKGKKTIQVLNKINQRGLMPVNITHCDGSLALATAYSRSIDEYNGIGEPQTIIHEIPASQRNGQKYICFPISYSSSEADLSPDGRQLIADIMAYLTAPTASVSAPELGITAFSLNGVEGKFEGTDSIMIELNELEFDSTYTYTRTLADEKYTHIETARGETEDKIDFSFCRYAPVVFVVTDYINRRPYDVVVRFYNPQGIDEVYAAGEWVNIYDIYGRLLTTTNEDVYTIALPHGLYIIVRETGDTFKLMR